MQKAKSKKDKRLKRHLRIRSKISGTNKIPRLHVFRSHKHIYAQLIDDEKGKTILSVSDFDLPKSLSKDKSIDKKLGKLELKNFRKVLIAYKVGELVAKKSLDKKITKIVFDKGGHKYHGRVEALAQGARDGGLKF